MLKNNNHPNTKDKEDNSSNNESGDSIYYIQLENYIQKLENDLKYYIKKYFQYKIRNNILETKINTYIKIEEDYEELKEKVKYEEGKFLENDRKDNEIIILRRENSILKEELSKLEEKNKKYEDKSKIEQDIIYTLKNEIVKLNQKISYINDINSNKVNENDNNPISRNISIGFLNCKNLVDSNNITTMKNNLDNFPNKYKETYSYNFNEADTNNSRNTSLFLKNKIINYNSSNSNK